MLSLFNLISQFSTDQLSNNFKVAYALEYTSLSEVFNWLNEDSYYESAEEEKQGTEKIPRQIKIDIIKLVQRIDQFVNPKTRGGRRSEEFVSDSPWQELFKEFNAFDFSQHKEETNLETIRSTFIFIAVAFGCLVVVLVVLRIMLIK